MSNVLEDLPNELLLIAFAYLSAYDLYQSLFNLNSRLNEICFNEKLHLDLSLRESLTNYYYSNQYLFLRNTFSIELNRSVSIDSDGFINLRTLIIKDGSLHDFNEILLNLHKLEHLSCLKTYSVLIDEANDILPILKQKTLKSLRFHSFNPIRFPNRINKDKYLTKLEYLSIDGCYLDDFFRMLEHTDSSLKKINVFLLYEQKYGEMSSLSLIYFPLESIVDLELTFNYLSFDNFQSILRCFSNLKYLKFSTLTNQFDYFSSHKWNSFISLNLLKLIRFQFYIRIIESSNNKVECPSIEFVESFYKRNQNWLNDSIVMDFHSEIQPKFIEFYSYSKHFHDGRSSSEFYGKQRFVVGLSKDFYLNFNKNIKHLKITLTDHFNYSNHQYEIYSQIKSIHIHSQLTNSSQQNHHYSKMLISDLVKSLPNFLNVTIIEFTSESSINPTSNLIFDLLNQMTNISTIRLSNDHLFDLIQFDSIKNIFQKQIKSLTIHFQRNSLTLDDFIQIEQIFCKTLNFFYIQIIDLADLNENLHLFFEILFSRNWKELYQFNLRCSRQTSNSFNQQFQYNFYQLIFKQKQVSKSFEYFIDKQQFSIYF